MSWMIVLVIAGVVAPILIAVATVLLQTRGAEGSGAIVRPAFAGIAIGAIGGVLVSALAFGIAWLVRDAR